MARYIPGGRVVLADGTYEFGGSVSLNKQKAHLQGMGGSTHIRPSTTGFNSLITVDEVHCRVGYVLLLDSGDDQHDLRYALYDVSQWWTIVENVHTHGAELRFDGSTGPAIIQHEFHGSSATGGADAGQNAVTFYNDADGFGVNYGRVHGGWMEYADRRTISIGNGTECTVEGLHCRVASQEAEDTYDMVLLWDGTGYSTVMGCHLAGVGQPRYTVHEASAGNDNSILGNRITGGVTQDLFLEGTGVSAANYADGTIK